MLWGRAENFPQCLVKITFRILVEFCIIKAAHLNFCSIKIMLGKLFFY